MMEIVRQVGKNDCICLKTNSFEILIENFLVLQRELSEEALVSSDKEVSQGSCISPMVKTCYNPNHWYCSNR